ncbi:cob(I)yrinic acid a,c-diamide adenosyltransferase [Candidatus Poribacteria bacterium]|nr:cob(I)yrinic acid a,c-diamide adenosyltransferase [Candidatus Poribacteria bacterium]
MRSLVIPPPLKARLAAEEAWRFASEKLASGEYDLVVLDEINYVVRYGLLDMDEVVKRDLRPRRWGSRDFDGA